MKCGFGWQVGNQYLVDELEIYQGCRMDLQISWNLVGLLRTGFRGVNLCTCGACTPVAPAARGDLPDPCASEGVTYISNLTVGPWAHGPTGLRPMGP